MQNQIITAVKNQINKMIERFVQIKLKFVEYRRELRKYLTELDRAQVIGLILVLAGIFLASFPYIQNIYYQRVQEAEVDRMLDEQKSEQTSSFESSENVQIRSEPKNHRESEGYQSLETLSNEQEDPVLKTENERGIKGEFAYDLEEGEGLIEIPKIDLHLPVGYGVELSDLETGPGFYPESGKPEEGNVSIAGHRTTYGAPFNRLDELNSGDEIILHYQGEELEYEVKESFDTASNDWSVIEVTSSPKLTLTTCHPPGSAERRLIVRANLVN